MRTGCPPEDTPAEADLAAAILKGRAPINLYNTGGTPAGTWLDNLHRTLDDAVTASLWLV